MSQYPGDDYPCERLPQAGETQHSTIHHSWIPSEPRLRIKLERGQKGTYAWEISYEDESSVAALVKIQEMDRMLRERFLPEAPGVLES